MSKDKRTVDDILAESDVEFQYAPDRQTTKSDMDTLRLSEELLDGPARQRTLLYQPVNEGLSEGSIADEGEWPAQAEIERELQQNGFRSTSSLGELITGERFKETNLYLFAPGNDVRLPSFSVYPKSCMIWLNNLIYVLKVKGSFRTEGASIVGARKPLDMLNEALTTLSPSRKQPGKIAVVFSGMARPGNGNDYLKYADTAEEAVKLLLKITNKRNLRLLNY